MEKHDCTSIFSDMCTIVLKNYTHTHTEREIEKEREEQGIIMHSVNAKLF